MAIRPGTDTKSELEQYGVWVKAEPQDIVDDGSSSEPDFDMPAEAPAVPEESFLSDAEEKLLGSFDSDFGVPGGVPDLDEVPSLEEPALTEGADGTVEAESLPDFDDEASSEAAGTPIENSEGAGPSPSSLPGVEIDMSSVEGLDNPESSGGRSSGSIEDVSAEFLDLPSETSGGAAASAKPEAAGSSDFVSGMDDVTAEFLDIEDSASAPRPAADSSSDFESLDIDLHFDDSVAGTSPSGASQQEPGFEAVTEFDDFLGSDSSEAKAKDGDFDDVSAVERELSAPSEAAPSAVSAPAAPGKPDLSTEILLKIADELSSIRGELVSLRTKIGDVAASSEASPLPKGSETLMEEKKDEAVSSGGFFDDEEDETIALTGDELDNILNTADFTTEEPEEPQELEDSLGFEAPPQLDAAEAPSLSAIPDLADEDLLSESLLPESGDYGSPAAIEPAIEEVRLGEADSVDSVVEEKDDLSLVAEEGIVPLTMAPEDTSYLESVESLDIGSELPPDKPLVEPDLSDFDIGLEELEPRAEVDEELPLASEGSTEIAPEAEDLTLDIAAEPGYSEPAVAEAEFLESIPEVEEPDFSEISLHEENPSSAEVSEVEEVEEISPLSEAQADEITEEEEDLMLKAVEPESSPAPSLAPAVPKASPSPQAAAPSDDGDRLKSEIKSVLSYLDKLLDSLPEDKIEEFAKSKYFDTYKKLFEELGLV